MTGAGRLLDPDPGLLADPDPPRDLLADQIGEGARWAANRLTTDLGKAFRGIGLVDDAVELGAEASDYRRRRTSRGKHPKPRQGGKAGKGFADRR